MLLAAWLLGSLAPAAARSGKERDPGGVVVSAEAQAKADQLIAAAVEARKGHDFAAAYRQLAEAYRVAPLPEVMYQLGGLAQDEGRTVDAYDLFRRYCAEVGSDNAQPLAATVVRGPRPQSGEVNVTGDRGSYVQVDDRLVGTLPLTQPLVLAPGVHRILVELGARKQQDEIKVLAERLAEMQFNVSSDVVVVTMEPAVLLLSDYLAVPPELPAVMEQSVDKALRQQHVGVQHRAAALLQAPALGGCLRERRCQLELAEKNFDAYVMLLRVDGPPRSGGSYAVNLELVDVGVGDRAAVWERQCPRCTAEQAINAVADAALRTFQQGKGRPRASLTVKSTPPGAEVLLAGRLIGKTPLKRPVWAGSYQMVLRTDGFRDEERQLQVQAGQRPTIEVTLSEGTAGAVALQSDSGAARPAQKPRPRWRLIAGGVAAGAGVILSGFGVSALAVKDSCIDTVPAGVCRSLYDTGAVGGGLLAVGLAFTVGGVVMMAWPGAR